MAATANTSVHVHPHPLSDCILLYFLVVGNRLQRKKTGSEETEVLAYPKRSLMRLPIFEVDVRLF